MTDTKVNKTWITKELFYYFEIKSVYKKSSRNKNRKRYLWNCKNCENHQYYDSQLCNSKASVGKSIELHESSQSVSSPHHEWLNII